MKGSQRSFFSLKERRESRTAMVAVHSVLSVGVAVRFVTRPIKSQGG